METNKFVYCYYSSDEEIKLTNEVLNGEVINSENSKKITDRVLKLSFVEQLHVLSRILGTYYDFENTNKDVEKFLGQNCFKSHGEIFLNMFDGDDDIQRLEKKYNIKIEIN
jgi:hypothetical protein